MVNRISSGTVSSLASVSIETIPPDLDTVVEQKQLIQQNIQQQSDDEQQLSKDKAIQLTDIMNRFLETANTQLRFHFHEKLNEYYVTIIDSIDGRNHTRDTIKETVGHSCSDARIYRHSCR